MDTLDRPEDAPETSHRPARTHKRLYCEGRATLNAANDCFLDEKLQLAPDSALKQLLARWFCAHFGIFANSQRRSIDCVSFG